MQDFINQTIHPAFTTLATFIGKGVEIVWYYPVIFLCIFCGIFFTCRFWFVQFRGFPHALKLLRGDYDNLG